MKIGVVPFVNPFSGGLYQYSLTMLEALSRISESGEDAFALLVSQIEECALLFDAAPIRYGGMRLEPLFRVDLSEPEAAASAANPPAPPKPNPDVIQFIRAYYDAHRASGFDWLLFTSPHPPPFERGLPYVAPVHDLQHRLQPEFPEVSADGEWDRREYQFRNLTRLAVLVIVDSEVGKEDVLNCYGEFGVTDDMVKVLPFLPANYLSVEVSPAERARVRAKLALPERYFFYPAQFWPHKNHLRVVEALHILDGGAPVHMVFSGGHGHGGDHARAGNFRTVMQAVTRYGLEDRVHYLGFVPNQDLSAIYAESAGLVMPTFFGPTNIPILEAWGFGCPVITSDIRGVREQAGDAALLVDPRSSEAIAEAMRQLWEDAETRTRLTQRGRARLAEYTPDDFRRRLAEIIDEAGARVRAGRYRAHPMVADLTG